MVIQILGTGCKRCKTLHEAVLAAVQATGVDASVEKIEDIQRIMSYELLMTPGLVIDGVVKVAGRLPSIEEIQRLILSTKAAT